MAKTPPMKRFLLLFHLAASWLLVSALSGQGNLTPPGAPAPTMKSLDQIDAKLETRTPISSAPFTISASGSYYLTKNLNVTTGDAITITGKQVTLDLNGFSITSTNPNAAGTGILLVGIINVTIFNGYIMGGVTLNGGTYSGPGFANGIAFNATGTFPNTVRVHHVTVSGCQANGINLGGNTIVESCTVETVGAVGIAAINVSRSTVRYAGGTAIQGQMVLDCFGQGGTGVSASQTASNCWGSGDPGVGVGATTAQNSVGYSTSGVGVSAVVADNCRGSSISNFGVSAEIVRGCYGSSTGSYGVQALKMANTSYGSSNSSFGLWATIGNTCWGSSNSGAATSIAYKYNSP